MRGVIMAEKKKKPYEIGELDQYLFGHKYAAECEG